ncbi:MULTISPECIES: LytR C-terminal domain-containing protein [Amycolatopsis]|uniref:LytR cell envelope-related transcriptional attenuator n=2 Tax=Amycolatopsis TaxID=1813 RepID=A0A1I4DDL8_9PSEU|nr:LytR C-terminal domain-containing protein [Amycolatopsis sacchari]SFK90870.1 LytR cell envelope-related transcriptional attenuator [Amycolatopsis sacchari]
MNFFQGLSRPMRLAGVALLGVAAIAAIIGIVTAVTGDNGKNTAEPPPATPTATAPGSEVPSSTTPPSSTAGSTPPPATGTTPPPAGTEAPGTAGPGQPGGAPASQPQNQNGGVPADQASAKWVPVRVYNNSTIHGLAARAANDLRADGWNVVQVDNYPYGIIPTTTAYYTPGTDEETAAKSLASWFNMKAEPRFEGIQNASPGVIVIVTNDYKGLRAKGS